MEIKGGIMSIKKDEMAEGEILTENGSDYCSICGDDIPACIICKSFIKGTIYCEANKNGRNDHCCENCFNNLGEE